MEIDHARDASQIGVEAFRSPSFSGPFDWVSGDAVHRNFCVSSAPGVRFPSCFQGSYFHHGPHEVGQALLHQT